ARGESNMENPETLRATSYSELNADVPATSETGGVRTLAAWNGFLIGPTEGLPAWGSDRSKRKVVGPDFGLFRRNDSARSTGLSRSEGVARNPVCRYLRGGE